MQHDQTFYFELAKLAVAAFTVFSISVAYKAYRSNLRKQDEDRIRDADKELVIQAQKSLEWAYNALTDEGRTIPPEASRLNWLTSARHLLRHRRIADRIKGEIYRIVHAEHEEFWRHRFYLALDDNALAATGYFTTNNGEPWPEKISLSSALIVVQFANWPVGLKDPTDEVDQESILNDKHALVGRAGRGVRAYARRLEEARKSRAASSEV